MEAVVTWTAFLLMRKRDFLKADRVTGFGYFFLILVLLQWTVEYQTW